jgi:hypothetical protein
MAKVYRADNGNIEFEMTVIRGRGNPEGFHQLAAAIAHAVRPTVIYQGAPPAAIPALSHTASPPTIEADFQPVTTPADSPAPSPTAVPTAKVAAAPKRRPPTPEILDELDLESGKVPFLQYYKQKQPDSHAKRYLVIAAWLKEHRQLQEITSDHIYTCYQLLRTPTVEDLGSVFRSCKKEGFFKSGSTRGSFVITHIGLNEVKKLGNKE